MEAAWMDLLVDLRWEEVLQWAVLQAQEALAWEPKMEATISTFTITAIVLPQCSAAASLNLQWACPWLPLWAVAYQWLLKWVALCQELVLLWECLWVRPPWVILLPWELL